MAAIKHDAHFSLAALEAFPPGRCVRDASKHFLKAALRNGLLFVAADERGPALGFLACGERDGALYIGEIDVWQFWQGKGIGRLLMQTVIVDGDEPLEVSGCGFHSFGKPASWLIRSQIAPHHSTSVITV